MKKGCADFGTSFLNVFRSSAYHGLPGEGEEIPGGNLDEAAGFIVDDDLDIRAIFKEHLPAVAAGRNNAIQVLFMNSHDGIKFSFPCRNGDAHGDVFGAGAVDAVTVDAGVNFPVFAQQGTAHGVVVYAVIKVFFQYIQAHPDQLMVCFGKRITDHGHPCFLNQCAFIVS